MTILGIGGILSDAACAILKDGKLAAAVEEKNKLDSLIYSTEKTLKDAGDKLSAEAKKPVEDALADVKKQLSSESAEELHKAHETLMAASHKMAEEMYKNAAASPGTGQPEGGATDSAGADASAGSGSGDKKDKSKDGVVDAEFEEQ